MRDALMPLTSLTLENATLEMAGWIALALFAALATVLHFASLALAARRFDGRPTPLPAALPPISIIRPVCGLDHALEETLRSGLTLAYPDYETLFCIDSPTDPAVPLLRRLMQAHPQAQARLLIGRDPISANPKLNNMVKGWRAARCEWIVMADSNVLMPPDYLTQLLACWDAKAGLVCSPPAGIAPGNFAATLECAFLNSHQARWQLVADSIGFGFAQGKTMLWRRADLEAAGGLAALAQDCAEDAAAAKLVRRAGRHVRLVPAPFPQPLGVRRPKDVWMRQMRWARLRRWSFPLVYAPELLSGGLLPLIAWFALAQAAGASPVPPVAMALAWYGAELGLIRRAGWPLSFATPVALLLRDLLLPVVWVAGLSGAGFVWRGHAMDARRPEAVAAAEQP